MDCMLISQLNIDEKEIAYIADAACSGVVK
jgi:hypothetical protein